MSMRGLEPLQITPHAPQACTSTIPPHRHLLYSVFIFCLDCGGDEHSVHPPSFLILNQKARSPCHIDKVQYLSYSKNNPMTSNFLRKVFRAVMTDFFHH